jgi:predicted esterase
MKTLVIFAHGKESGPWGLKIRHLAGIAEQLGAEVLSPDYSDLPDAAERVARLLALPLPAHDRLILAGSSMGGYVSTVASKTLKPAGLFLMAPAFYMPGYAEENQKPVADKVCVVFGWQDEIIPVEHGIRFAQTHHAQLHVMDSDHRLGNVLNEVGQLFKLFLSCDELRNEHESI